MDSTCGIFPYFSLAFDAVYPKKKIDKFQSVGYVAQWHHVSVEIQLKYGVSQCLLLCGLTLKKLRRDYYTRAFLAS